MQVETAVATILIIDDNALVRDMAKEALARAGYGVEIAADGRDGLQIMATRRVDLVVTDLVMPEKEGLETIQLLRQITRSLPILAISGASKTGRADLLDLARRMGATEVLPKPFEPGELVTRVGALLSARLDSPSRPFVSGASNAGSH